METKDDSTQGANVTPSWSDKYTRFNLMIFVLFSLTSLGIVVFKEGLDNYQQFYLRIFIGLSGAGIAAIIPGFLEIDLRWLRNTIRAGGAIAVFVIIYSKNPPEIEHFGTVSQLEGEWEYYCNSKSNALPYGSANFGGTANFMKVKHSYGYGISITGRRTWELIDSVKTPVLLPNSWQTISGSITSDDKLIYEYQTMDERPRHGFCSFSIVRDKNLDIIGLDGNFFRVDSPLTNGQIRMHRLK